MAKTSEISTNLRGKVVQFYKEGISIQTSIAKRLDMPRRTVFSIVKKFRETGEVKNVPEDNAQNRQTCKTVSNEKQKKHQLKVKKATVTGQCAQTVHNRLNDNYLRRNP